MNISTTSTKYYRGDQSQNIYYVSPVYFEEEKNMLKTRDFLNQTVWKRHVIEQNFKQELSIHNHEGDRD